jgi:hypothetical protein
MPAQAFALNAPLSNGGNPGIRRYRKVALTAKDAVWQAGECATYAYLFRNASTSVVYVNFYDAPAAQVTVGGTLLPVSRLLIPAATSASIPGQLIITIAPDSLDWFTNGLTIAPVLTDSDAAAAGGTVYAEIRFVGNGG